MTLPKFDASANTWIEITKSDHEHGGKGWEFGTCLWSPTTNKAGNDFYAIMREPQANDLVLHFYEHRWPDGVRESRFCGYSRIKEPFRVTEDQPPVNSDWGFSDTYFRIDLKGYKWLAEPLPIRILRTDYEEELRSEHASNNLSHYPFAVRKDGIRLSQGRYLARCTQRLYGLIHEAFEIEISGQPSESDSADTSPEKLIFTEGKRAVREQSYFVRNRSLATLAKEKAGYVCEACGLDPVKHYGEIGKRLIDCHHLVPISTRSGLQEREGTSLHDVAVLCSNCHRLAHSRKVPLSLPELTLKVRRTN